MKRLIFRDGCQECQRAKEELLNEIENGNAKDLAEKYEIGVGAIYGFRSTYSNTRKKRTYRLDDRKVEELRLGLIKTKRQEGWTYEQIGKLLGITRQAVHLRLTEHNKAQGKQLWLSRKTT